MQTTSEAAWTSPIGRRTPRVDGPQKVSGTAKYTSDFNFPGQLYAVPVEATIANGRITSIDASEAEKMPGVPRCCTARTLELSTAPCWNRSSKASPRNGVRRLKTT